MTAHLAENLFATNELGAQTFKIAVRDSHPTPWSYAHFRKQLFAAARKNHEDAVEWLVVAALRREPSYAVGEILTGLRGNAEALGSAAEVAAFQAQHLAAESPELAIAAQFWEALLAADSQIIPRSALHPLGRRAFVDSVPNESWPPAMVRTLELTGGEIDMCTEVADRCS
ncbi:hypothetical protein HDA40_001879 [Hamadaea flava]|uniref:Uncharacterized protein n=1 Tax=Hamadaea flava TaxID=1742688 RepID=A0ABV8LDR0_9ACTN|nr:hypothetical protein [Hamadaea flava]MCP2323372.1 hypothetical protein [Hamadaea flava]